MGGQYPQRQAGRHIHDHMLAEGQGGIRNADTPHPIAKEHPQRCAKAVEQMMQPDTGKNRGGDMQRRAGIARSIRMFK